MELNKQAVKLNKILQNNNPAVFDLLSERGRQIYFPHDGILGQTAEAKGKKLNATIGIAYEDDGSTMVLDCLSKQISLDKDSVFPYAPSFGKKEIRQAWHQQILKKNPSIKSAISLPIVTSALTHGLSIAAFLLADPDTEVVLAEPFWGNYKLTFDVTYGLKLVSFSLFTDGQFNVDGLTEKLQSGSAKKIIVLNFPNNPCGYTPTVKEVEKLVKVLAEYVKNNQLTVICDDAYFGLVYEKGVFTESIFSRLADISENLLAVKIDGCTKEDFTWGFRVGFITFGCRNGNKKLYAALEDKAAGAVRATTSNAPNVSQALLHQAFTSPGYEKEKAVKRKLLKQRYMEIKRILASHQEYAEYFTPLPFNSGYFMCLQLIKTLGAEQVRQHLLDKYDTGLISIGNMLRVAFSSIAATKLQDIFNNIYKACQDLER